MCTSVDGISHISVYDRWKMVRRDSTQRNQLMAGNPPSSQTDNIQDKNLCKQKILKDLQPSFSFTVTHEVYSWSNKHKLENLAWNFLLVINLNIPLQIKRWRIGKIAANCCDSLR